MNASLIGGYPSEPLARGFGKATLRIIHTRQMFRSLGVSNHLNMWVVEDDDIRSSISILRRAGLDPWKCIAVVSEDK